MKSDAYRSYLIPITVLNAVLNNSSVTFQNLILTSVDSDHL